MIWSIAGKRVVITGPTSGIGRSTAIQLSRLGADVVLVGRDHTRLTTVARSLRSPEIVVCDLADLTSVRGAAHQIRSSPVDVLINNAGVAGVKGVTKDGFEMHFGTNHLGHYLLTKLLVDAMSSGDRVITLTSAIHHRVESFDWSSLSEGAARTGRLHAYAVSKAANVLFASELTRRFPPLTSVSVHPGLVASDIWRPIPALLRPLVTRSMASPTEGMATTIMCATAPTLRNGYYADSVRTEPSSLARDPAVAQELWERSEGWVQKFLG